MKKETTHNEIFSKNVAQKENLKLKNRRNKSSVWTGFGLFGMVGWTVAVPVLAGAALGIWLDKKYSQHFSWTLTCLISGLIFGCIIAWNWVEKENKKIRKNMEDNNE